MRRHSFFILCFLLGLAASAAVPGELRGTLIDAENGEPVIGAVIQALNRANKPLSFGSSNANGAFRLNVKAGTDSISFRCMGYEPLKLPVTADFSKIALTPAATQLKDVIVKAPNIYAKGDTLVFNVEKFANAKDNAIIDVIKRLPGIKVEEDGTIKYQGKPINKFYLDGNDFLGGQYGLATENISHKDVKSVEVMENHQPVKALDGIEFPEEAGINLKLKEDARSRWVGVGEVAAGAAPLLLDGSLFTMRIAPKTQSMFTLKADNTGWNPATQIREHTYDDMFSNGYAESLWGEYISADAVNAPLSEKRTRDNLSWLANAITAWRVADTSMRLKLNYMGDRLDYTSGITTDYFSQSIPDFIQRNDLRTQSHELSAQLNAEVNKREYFLKNKLNLLADWDKSRSAITGTYDLSQSVNRRALSATNDLKLVKRNDTRLFTLSSRNSFSHNPDRLRVNAENEALQRIGITDFRSTTETRFARLSRFWKYHLSAGADINYHHLNTRLNGMAEFDNSNRYNAFISKLYATPKVEYERNGWRVSFSLPLKWEHYTLRGEHDFINLLPWLYLRRQVTAKSDISASVSYSLMPEAPHTYIDAPILNDYRNLFIAESSGKYPQTTSANISYRFRNPLNALFVNASASYSHSHSPLTSNQLFINDFIISTFACHKSTSDAWSAKGGISKGLGHGRMVIGIDASVANTSAESMRDNNMIPYRQLTATVQPYFKGSLLKWLSMNYEAKGGYSRLKIDRSDNTSYHTLTQNLALSLMPNDFIQFTAGAEHYLTHFPKGDPDKSSSTANLVLLDLSAVWHPANKIRISLTANNILDRRHYRYVTYGTLSRSEHIFSIRPRTILASLQFRF